MKKTLLFLFFIPFLGFTQNPSDLLITEITDPQNSSTSGRYVEIYNSGTQDINLSTGYALVRWTNASASAQSSVGLNGIIPAGGFYVVCNSGTKFLSTYGFAASQSIGTGGPADSNGDDNIALLAPDGSIIDMFGVAGEDGSGTGHEFEDGRAERTCSSTLPTATWQASDWNIDNDSGGGNGPQYAPADFDPFAWICITTNLSGCTDTSAVNYSANATTDDGSCCFVSGCTDSLAFNYDATVCFDDNSCIPFSYGCTDASAANYTANANTDDGSCCFLSGCTDSLSFNYDATVCYDDGSCITPNFGCMSASAMNFDSTANMDDNSCIYLSDKIDLFFSEYGEGNSNNKYLEIYNSTSSPVDLSSYALTRVSNAPTNTGVYEYWVNFDSAAIISANDVYIVAHPSSDSSILSQSDMTYSALSNGDDGFALVYGGKPSSPVLPGNEYIILDFLGDFLGDPGSGWDVAGITEATKDHVLVRKCSIELGNTDWTTSSGVDSISSEWLVLANEDWTDLGVHTNPCSIIVISGCTDSTATNYNASATADDGSCYYACSDNIFYMNMSRLASYGWWSTTYTIVDTSGNIITSGTCDSLSSDIDTLCLADGCFSVEINGYSPYGGCEASLWNITSINGDTVAVQGDCYSYIDLSNPVQYSGFYSVNFSVGNSICAFYGCTDSAAENYWQSANTDDGSCFYSDCTDSTATNYNPAAVWDDGSCTYIDVYGCTDATASNYDPLATIDDGSCQYIGISITNPLANDNFTTSNNIILDFTVNNFTVGLPSSGGDGHIHYYVNGILTPHFDITSILLPNLANGEYEVIMGLFDNSHQPISPYIADTVSFSINVINGCTDSTAINYDSTATVDDGSCIPFTYGCTDSTADNYNATVNTDDGSCLYFGCMDATANNYDATATVDDGSCTYTSVSGCTDVAACNYDATATSDDGSCEFTSCVGCSDDLVTDLFVSDIIDDRVVAKFDNMNTYDASGAQICRVDQIRIRYREVGTTSWSQKNIASPVGYDPTTGICTSTQKTDKNIYGLTLGTTYEWEVKLWYCSTGATGWAVGPNFTTLDECPNIANFTAYGATATKATFDWDASNGSYEFARIRMRVDSISSPVASDWFQVGGFGVNYGTFTKDKNGLVAGESYRALARTWCNPNGGAYNSLAWTPLVTWTQPITARLVNPELTERTLSRITDLLGREVNPNTVIHKTTLLYIYNDGSVEKKIIME